MTIEAFSYISNFNSSYPDGTDWKYEGDDHIRGIKYTLQTQFPNLNAAVNFTPAEANLLTGWTYRGEAASLDAGNVAGEVPVLVDVGGTPGLPQLDGSRLTGIATTDVLIADTNIFSLLHSRTTLYFYGQLK